MYSSDEDYMCSYKVRGAQFCWMKGSEGEKNIFD